MSDYGEKTCPLCAEEMDLTDQQLKPCKCGYQICVWCWHHIMDMAEKDQSEGRCPACRTPYDKEKIVGMTVDQERLTSEGNMDRKKTQKSKLKPSEGRKPLTSVRVVRRNLVYIVGLPLNLADEDLLQHKEYFGQYGKVLKVSMSRTATGLIQQFPNNTCSVYITYGKEEEAVRCIQSVHGFILDGKALKACFGTTKYCHAWLRNAACNNPDCLYLHEVGSQEDSFTKDEIISAYTRVQQITGATNTMQYRSGSMLPPPLDAYSSDSSTANPIAKVPSTTSVSAPRSSPPSGSSGKSTALPAAASWGARLTNQHSLATSALSNGSLDNQRSTSENGTLAMSTVVANAAHGPVTSSNTLQKPPLKEEIQTLAEKSKPSVLKPLQQKIVLDSGSKRTTSPNRDPSSNQISCLEESSYNSRVIDKPSAVENSFEHTNEIAEDFPDVSNLSADVAWMGITSNSRDEAPGVPVGIGTHCDQGSIRQPDNDVQNLERCRKDSPTTTYAEAGISQNGIHGSRPEWDWRSGSRSQIDVKAQVDVNDFSSFNNNRRDVAEAVSHSTYMFSSSSSILDSNHLASGSFQTRETSARMDSNTGSTFEIGSDSLHLPNRFSEKAISKMEHSLFANEGRSNIQNAEDDIISNILDFDPWDESLTSPHNFAKLLGQSDHSASTLESSNLLKQHNDQSRFSFARHEESNNQAYDNKSYSIYGQLSRDQPLQEFGVNRDMYQDKLGSQNGFASNYSGGYEQFAASPGLSSYKSPVARTQVSAPPGFSAPNRLPPPGFSSHERADLSSDSASGTRLLDSANLLRNAYHVPPPSGNLNAAGDIEFMDPAILAVGRGRLHNGMETADFDMRSGFSSQLNSFENDARLQLLAQRSLAAQQVNGFHDPRNVNNFSSSVSDPYGIISSRLMDQTQGAGLSPFTQLPRQASPNPLLSNGHWDKWNEPQSGNNLGITQLLRNERMGFNDNVYSRFEEPKFRRPSPGDPYNRTYGM
ncbi:RNA recognition motif domain eukaryote [Arabidopsis suecica]|uniref:RNA recognition motif domain eukaryote n=1 Tax=Arabidopsis suecica TaxID=45249 RepID=A0A8T1ZXE0_ARASU|nr:RNA recognition motif domain eukaryote [Arabidopsis suecica]